MARKARNGIVYPYKVERKKEAGRWHNQGLPQLRVQDRREDLQLQEVRRREPASDRTAPRASQIRQHQQHVSHVGRIFGTMVGTTAEGCRPEDFRQLSNHRPQASAPIPFAENGEHERRSLRPHRKWSHRREDHRWQENAREGQSQPPPPDAHHIEPDLQCRRSG